MSPRYHILYEFRDGPWGGGNQFLKALKKSLTEKNSYCEKIEDADIVLFNSHHFGKDNEALNALFKIRQSRPHVPFVHRVDGPIRLVRGYDLMTDRVIFEANSALADATVFQTGWSRDHSLRLGMKPKTLSTVIMNAPDAAYFYPDASRARGPIPRLIATSWAANKRKGFDIYEYLDQNLDFSRYEMTFIGNSPYNFQKATHLAPMDSAALGAMLRRHDIYITASVNDPCSNALCEAMACGLPALVRNSGGHPEIMKKGGLAFDGKNDILRRIELLVTGYDQFKANIDIASIGQIADHYIDFAKICIAQKAANSVSEVDIARLHRGLKLNRLTERAVSGLARRFGS